MSQRVSWRRPPQGEQGHMPKKPPARIAVCMHKGNPTYGNPVGALF
eukprot:CAMPEP_0203894382 /NCGR_PEP_ID=MMETSP0359-20131031/37361_1 /ASSEMBLY_ACC=CAM_ASM_000338 /TAXON_ID=268821 /ORGANISM="Scrippsiella Hangoei, Strain SHTV-5" /LENGTH=45 /DNA_ID= /DNA_START= /DNA_END= /DNA_ORIENTATION=